MFSDKLGGSGAGKFVIGSAKVELGDIGAVAVIVGSVLPCPLSKRATASGPA